MNKHVPRETCSASSLGCDRTRCIMQVAIITGSGQGLGASAAKLFAQHGAKLVVTDLDGSKAEQVWQIQLLLWPHGKLFTAESKALPSQLPGCPRDQISRRGGSCSCWRCHCRGISSKMCGGNRQGLRYHRHFDQQRWYSCYISLRSSAL